MSFISLLLGIFCRHYLLLLQWGGKCLGVSCVGYLPLQTLWGRGKKVGEKLSMTMRQGHPKQAANGRNPILSISPLFRGCPT